MSRRQRHRRDAGQLTDALLALSAVAAALVVLLGVYLAFVAYTAAAGLLRLAEILTHTGG